MCNGQNCNCKNRTSGWLVFIALLMFVGVGIFAYNSFLSKYIEPPVVVEQEQVTSEKIPMTIDQRIGQWKDQVQSDYAIETYLTLPELILREVLKKVNPDATVAEIVEEYDRNTRYYLSKYVQDSFKPELSGPDAKKIDHIEIQTVMKEPEKTTTAVSIIAKDSLK